MSYFMLYGLFHAVWIKDQVLTNIADGMGNSSYREHLIDLLKLEIFWRLSCMNVLKTTLNDVLLIEPRVYRDDRGFFLESWNKKTFDAALGQSVDFVQDNHSRSTKGVLRGLHYQLNVPQGKLVRVTKGAVLDVVVDMRLSSLTFGHYYSVELTADNADATSFSLKLLPGGASWDRRAKYTAI